MTLNFLPYTGHFFICPIKSIKISSLKDETRIVSVDLQKMAPIFGVTLIEGDITKDSTVGNFLSKLKIVQML
jgi:23S rRNA U2552 (ribose-2'-O)-methylase RlmE/FtsJ